MSPLVLVIAPSCRVDLLSSFLADELIDATSRPTGITQYPQHNYTDSNYIV